MGLGKVIVKIKLTNLFDLALLSRGLAKKKPRVVEAEALVDTGATRLYLKPSVIRKLGLQRVDTVRSQTTNGEAIRYKYEPVQLEFSCPGAAPEALDFAPAPLVERLRAVAPLPAGHTRRKS